jgi:LmbE family N-acetylglucosaminyl deacetylase
MKILAIGSHPDDIEVGCDGSLLKYANKGHEIYLMIMTEGDRGGDSETRREEQIKAAEILKVRKIFWGGYQDTQLTPNINDMVSRIEDILQDIRPNFTFVNYGDDTHQDHRSLCQAVVSATRYIKNVLFYEVPTTQNFSAEVFVDIKDTLEGKISALLAHQSQVTKTNIEGLSIADIVKSGANFRGIQGRVQFAEGFIPLRLFINVS